MMYKELLQTAEQAIAIAYGRKEVHVLFTQPEERERGDAMTSAALSLSKSLKVHPREIAAVIAKSLEGHASVDRVEIVGPGYVNVWLNPPALLRELNQSRQAHVAKVADKLTRPVIVEYSQPNIAKPLGVHHLLTTVIGQALVNLYRHLGHHTIAINHLGDWGTQFGKLAVAYEKWGSKELEQCSIDDLLALYVRFHEEVEKDPTLEDLGRDAFRRLEQGDQNLRAFWQTTVRVTMEAMEKLYGRLGVSFDFVQGESFYEEKMEPIIEEGKTKGVFTEGEKGALIALFPEESKLPPAIVMKGDGATIYHTRDLATIRYRIDTWHPTSILYVVDVAQELYFKQLFAMVRALGWELPHLEHIVFGRMSFADRSMSTRQGNILKLEDVLDEAVRRADQKIAEHEESIQTENRPELADMMGIGAIVYGILSQNRKMNMIFDWDKILSFEGNSAPYLQYTHARARSVLRKGDAEGAWSLPTAVEAFTEKERLLVGTLMQFQNVLQEALAQHMPHKIANYLFLLCQDFNAFYNTEPILKAEDAERRLRLALTACTADVLKVGAGILTMRVPDSM